jgi:RHS repeat-associated protein
LGSTSLVVDKATSELVEATTYLGYGARESDYRPGRWEGFREDYGFTGKEEDQEVGLTYFGKRFLSPYLGRWVSADPLGVHRVNHADPNLYAYVHGTVLSYIDPRGLDRLAAGTGVEIEGGQTIEFPVDTIEVTPPAPPNLSPGFPEPSNQGSGEAGHGGHIPEANGGGPDSGRYQPGTRGEGESNPVGEAMSAVNPAANAMSSLSDLEEERRAGHISPLTVVAVGIAVAPGGYFEKKAIRVLKALFPEVKSSIARLVIHHIATNKNFERGAKWSTKFEPIFERAGMKLSDSANTVGLVGHVGPHPDAYHQKVYDRLHSALDGAETQEQAKAALVKELNAMATELQDAKSELAKLLNQ